MNEKEQRILDLYKKGETVSNIAEMESVSRHSVMKIARQNFALRHGRLTLETRAKVIEMYKNGESIASIMEANEIKAVQTIYSVLKRGNIKLRFK